MSDWQGPICPWCEAMAMHPERCVSEGGHFNVAGFEMNWAVNWLRIEPQSVRDTLRETESA